MKSTVRTVAGMACAVLILGCPKAETPPPPPAPVATPTEPPAPEEPQRKEPQRLKWRPGLVPTSEEADFALSLGKMLFEQANFEEAEEQLRIASAGGKSEADGLLLRARAEIEAKKKLAAARQALQEKDYAKARQEFDSIPAGSVLSAVAQQIAEEIEEAHARREQEFEEKAIAAVNAELQPKAPRVPKAKSDGGIEIIAGDPTHQESDEEEEPTPDEPE
ncbi:MAG: hypothetical protein ACOX6T_00255 [Myxococcales bacterium]|jgi:hypothetical protein